MKKGWPEQQVKRGLEEAIGRDVEDGVTEKAEKTGESVNQNTLPGVASLLRETIKAYRERFFTYLGIVLLPAGFMALLGFAASSIFSIQDTVANFSSGTVSEILQPNLLLPFFFVVLINALVQVWSLVSLLCAVRDREKPEGVIAAFQKGWKKILPYIWIVFLIGFIIMGGFVFFFIPALIFSVWFSFAVLILITEDIRGLDALLKSKEYVSGQWWPVFWRQTIGALVISLTATVLSFILSFILGLLVGKGGGSLASALTMVFVPLAAVYSFLLYEELKRIKGEFDFTPKKKEKIAFLSVGFLGTAIMLAAVAGGIVLFSRIFLSQGSMSQAQDARIIANMSQLRVTAELIYDGDYESFRLDHEEVAPWAHEISELGGNLVIKTGGSAYCAYTELAGGDYYCISSSGGARRTEVVPSGVCNDRSFGCPEENVMRLDPDSVF